MRRGLVAAALLAGLGALPAQARELWRSGDAALDVSGSLREVLIGTHGTDADEFAARADASCLQAASFPDCPSFGAVGDAAVVTSLTRLRGRLELRMTERLGATLVYDHELRAGNLDSFEAGLGEAFAPEPWAPFDWTIEAGDRFAWDHRLYRFHLDYRGERFEATLGRQRIPWGVGRLWNPIDRFNAIGPLAIEADQSVGVDALDVRLRFSGFSYLQAVYAPADDPAEASWALRLHGVVRDVDASLVAGRWEEATAVGFDLEGNLGGAAARVEVMWTHSDRDVRPVGAGAPSDLGSFWQAVVSIDHLFDWGTGLYALVEHLYNGNALGFGGGRAGALLPFFEETDAPPPGAPPGLPGPFVRPVSSARFGGSRVVTRSENLTGLMLGYDLTPEVRAELLSIVDWNGGSASFFPLLRYGAFDWLELSLGAQLFAGPRRSEFGDAEALGFLIAEVFF